MSTIDHSWRPRVLTREQLQPSAHPEIGGILYRTHRHLVSGEPETLKGWFLLVLSLEELRSGSHVAWVDFEQGPSMTLGRLRDLGATDDELERFLYIEPREPLDQSAREELTGIIAEAKPTLVVFDAYAGLLGLEDGDPNSEQAIERVNRRYIDMFRHAGAATVIVDHPVKNPTERGRYSGGSGRKLAEVDVHLRLTRGQPFGKGHTGTARIDVLKDRPGGLPHPSIGTLALTSCPTSGQITWEIRAPENDTAAITSFRPTGYMEKVSVYLELQTGPVSRNQVETTVTGKAPVIRTALDHLTHEGYVVETRGQRGARLVTSEKSYREARDEVGTRSPSADANQSLDLVQTEPLETEGNDLVPPRPHLVPTSSRDEDDDFVPRRSPLRGDEDEVGADELERLLTDHADIAAPEPEPTISNLLEQLAKTDQP